MGIIYRNTVTVTKVHHRRGKQFAFGIIHEPTPRTVFFPYWVIKAFQLTSLDQGEKFDCLYIDQPEDDNPVVLTILDDDVLQESEIAGSYTGRPGTSSFNALVNQLNGSQA